jgi:hypothetical protein
MHCHFLYRQHSCPAAPESIDEAGQLNFLTMSKATSSVVTVVASKSCSAFLPLFRCSVGEESERCKDEELTYHVTTVKPARRDFYIIGWSKVIMAINNTYACLLTFFLSGPSCLDSLSRYAIWHCHSQRWK